MKGLFSLLILFLWLGIGRGQGPMPTDSSIWSIQLPEYVTTAQPEPTDARSALHSVRVLKAEELNRRGVTNLAQALEQTIGIRLQQDLVLGSSLTMMGLGGQNIQIMIDGVPIIGRQGGNVDLGQINLDQVLRVELVEGPLGVAYGTNALAGVINIITKSSQLDPYEVQLTHQYESRGESRLAAGAGLKLHPEWLLRVQGGRDHFAGWKADESARAHLWNPKEQYFAEANLVFTPTTDRKIRVQSRWFDEEVSLLGNTRRPQFKPYAIDQFFRTRRTDLALHYEGGIGERGYARLTTGFNRFARQRNMYRVDLEADESAAVTGNQDTSRFDSWMLRGQWAYPRKLDRWQVQAGVDLRYDRGAGDRIIGENGADWASMTDLAGFVKFSYRPIDELTLQAGGRYAYNSRYDAPLIPSLHLKYAPSDQWQWRASYGRGFRSPDLKELFFEFIDINHFILGNPNLQAETADHLQSTLTHTRQLAGGQLDVQAMLFYNDLSNRIALFEYIETPDGLQPAVDTSTLRFSYFNMDRFFTQGARLGLNWQHEDWTIGMQANANGLYNPESAETATINRFSYQWSGNANLSYRFEQGLPWEISAFVHFQDRIITHYPDQDAQGQTVFRERIQNGFTQVDLSLSTRFWSDRISMVVGVRNALNVQQVDISGGGSGGGAHGGGANWAPISPGRSFFVSTQCRLGWGQSGE